MVRTTGDVVVVVVVAGDGVGDAVGGVLMFVFGVFTGAVQSEG